MPENKRKIMRLDGFFNKTLKSVPRFRNAPRRAVLLCGIALLLAFTPACAPPASQTNSQSGDLPELTDEMIRERINGAYLSDVPEENGSAEPINWGFDENEPKEIAVVEKRVDGPRATIVLDVKTRSARHVRNPRELAGRIRTEWLLKTGWALRQWEIVETENISMKYKNLPPPAAENSNRNANARN